MAQRGFSARGEIVDFELLKIKQQLATTPAPTTVSARRLFIEEKAGLVKRDSGKMLDALSAGAIGIDEQGIEVAEEQLQVLADTLIPETTKA